MDENNIENASDAKMNVTHREVSGRGGKRTLALYGKDHYVELGKKSAAAQRKAWGYYWAAMAREGASSLSCQPMVKCQSNKRALDTIGGPLETDVPTAFLNGYYMYKRNDRTVKFKAKPSPDQDTIFRYIHTSSKPPSTARYARCDHGIWILTDPERATHALWQIGSTGYLFDITDLKTPGRRTK